jgi:hypothetical protein
VSGFPVRDKREPIIPLRIAYAYKKPPLPEWGDGGYFYVKTVG